MRPFPNKKLAPLNEVEAMIWKCTGPDCRGWMRQEFSLQARPQCPLCSSEMGLAKQKVPDISDMFPIINTE